MKLQEFQIDSNIVYMYIESKLALNYCKQAIAIWICLTLDNNGNKWQQLTGKESAKLINII